MRPAEKGRALNDVAILVLAGGHGRRFGQPKANVMLGGQTLLDRAVARARACSDEVMISGPPELGRPGAPAVQDAQAGVGPLAGILAGLTAARAPAVIILPCDSPFISDAFLRGLAGLAGLADAVVPQMNGMWEPLHGLYGKSCVGPIAELIALGERKIIQLYPEVRVLAVTEEVWGQWDPEGLAFHNINYPEDLERAREILAAGKGVV